MPLVPTRLLIIHRQLDFAVTVKKSLEQLGGFEAAAFTAPDTALEYVRHRPHDIALIDFAIRGVPGIEIVAKLRAMQPDIAIIATPKNAETVSAMRDYDLQDTIDTPMPVRQLIPVIQRAVKQARETLLPDTVEAPSLGDSQTIRPAPPEFSSLEKILENIGSVENHTETIEVDMSDIAAINTKRETSAFEQLAAEEPPMPSVEENATVRDLRDSLMESGDRVVVEMLSANQALEQAQPLPPDDGDDPDEPILARKILEGTLDQTSSLKTLVEEVAPESHFIEAAAALEAEPPVAKEDSKPPEVTDKPPTLSTIHRAALADEAQLAQIALELTQASLELAAVATLLTRADEVIATSGSLPPEDIEELKNRFAGEWATGGDTQSRIRFINLPGSGKDYMLYSRRVEGELILTMIFAGNMPLKAMRRQSDKLLSVLTTIPDLETEEEQQAEPIALPEPTLEILSEQALDAAAKVGVEPTQVYTGPSYPYTYTWMLRDPNQTLSDALAQAVVAGMDLYLTEHGWTIKTLRVHEDYIYLFAEVPGERPANDVIQELKRYSAELITAKVPNLDPETLWANAYLALYPGRDMETNEIQRFIRFTRMT